MTKNKGKKRKKKKKKIWERKKRRKSERGEGRNKGKANPPFRPYCRRPPGRVTGSRPKPRLQHARYYCI